MEGSQGQTGEEMFVSREEGKEEEEAGGGMSGGWGHQSAGPHHGDCLSVSALFSVL